MSAECIALAFDLPSLTSPMLNEELKRNEHPKLRLVGSSSNESEAQPVKVTGRLTISF